MSNDKLFIPERINVGFQSREDTYTKKLAYVIYYDLKGVLRKEASWNGWRDKTIDSKEFKNEPTEGFVLNKGVGGAKHSYGYNVRNEYIRVYDPRDFEFEISVANLLFILRECDCSRGKGLEGKFVYSWEGTQLVLLPATSQEYKASQKHTGLQGKKVSAKDLIKGATYTTKNSENFVYLGRFAVHPNYPRNTKYGYGYQTPTKAEKMHTFWDLSRKEFYFSNSMNSFAACVNEQPTPEYADLVDQYYNSIHGTPVKELVLVDAPDISISPDSPSYYWNSEEKIFAHEHNDGFAQYHYEWATPHQEWSLTQRSVQPTKPKFLFIRYEQHKAKLVDGVVTFDYDGRSYVSLPTEHNTAINITRVTGSTYHPVSTTIVEPWVDRKKQYLEAVLESGARFRVGRYQLLLAKDTSEKVTEDEDGHGQD